ncbi:hypothetical protein KAFR_0I02250 [Kazachstania africana CBS 2517]|uniref:SGF29 C-terminal domain-containing protein n=1 Tax=Kazachstania africana (strain ATCC 22294 / BCRC 22015 / CBS 2517 / CECT 1963 / NBRC 1671 / NRRL Y-8276) TaxID=1071382 RepID=H2B054_KAZAF|nr:hypothetical protein KAFR_0I02250 [Kazachstania africana CBS 2517]CCF60004.1 hypothetical protein KAFR_0I02250 [Kazachstania africana CBS 2517]
MDGQWESVVSSLQDIYNANEVTQFDDDVNTKRINFENLPNEQLNSNIEKFQEHMENITRAHKLLDRVRSNLQTILDYENEHQPEEGTAEDVSMPTTRNNTPTSLHAEAKQYWVSQYNPVETIKVGSEVAYRPKRGGDGEWFQCEVIKISSDGTRLEVRDPEPDELGNTGKVFKCTWKDIIAIPNVNVKYTKGKIVNYPAGSKVLARYPETTTFYPAVVIGSKRDGTCRLRFDGEEEVDKETEVTRKLVLPMPMISASPMKK